MKLAVLVLAAAAYSSWIKGDFVHVRFSGDLGRIHGPFQFAVRPDVSPGVPTDGCENGPAPMYVVTPDHVEQRWPPGAKYVEAAFSTRYVGGLQHFFFTATTVTADSEWCLQQGEVPNK